MYLWPQFWNPAWLGGSTRDSVDPGLEPGRVEEKIGEGTTRCDPADPATRSKTRLRSVDFFFFFTKTTSFWFKKKRIDSGDPVTRSKPRTRALDRAGHWAESENYAYDNSSIYLFIYLCYFSIYPRNRHLQLIRMGDSTA